MSGGFNNVFPNLSWLRGVHTLRVWHPKGPNALEAWKFVFVDKAVPQEVKQAMLWLTEKQFGAAGRAEQDDGENWSLIGNNLAGRGPQIHKLALHYRMGLGHEGSNKDYPGEIVNSRFAESAQRMFYRRWREFMTTEQWPVPAPVVSAGERALSTDC